MFFLTVGAKYPFFGSSSWTISEVEEKFITTFKSPFDLYLLLNFFDLRSYSSKSSKIYTFRLLLLVRLYMLREGIFYFLVRHWDEVFRKVLSLVSLNSQLLAKMLNFIFIKVTCKLRYLRWFNFVQENWLRTHPSCLHWKWLICFRI